MLVCVFIRRNFPNYCLVDIKKRDQLHGYLVTRMCARWRGSSDDVFTSILWSVMSVLPKQTAKNLNNRVILPVFLGINRNIILLYVCCVFFTTIEKLMNNIHSFSF